MLERVRRQLETRGICGTVRRAGELTAERIYFAERYVWYALALGDDRPRRELPPGLRLRQGDRRDLGLLERLEALPAREAEDRLAGGHDWWLVTEGERAAFSCWIFRGRAPALAARGGWLTLSDDTVCLEDSVTSADFRGRGVAPGAWTALADSLAGEGLRTIITKIREDNAPSRCAVQKVGFREAALVDLWRVGSQKRVAVSSLNGADGLFSSKRLSTR